TAEVSALFRTMITLFELLIAVFMEKQTQKDNRNSSLPSSQTDKDETSTQSGANGKGKEHNGTVSGNTRTVETIQVAQVTECECCGEDLDDIPASGHERRTKIDIIFEKVVSHVDAEIKVCPQCDTRNKGRFPADMAGPVQYGPGIKAYVVNLLIAQMISLKRVQQSIQVLIGRILSEATILKYVWQLHQALEAWEQSAIEQLLQMPTLHVDETSLRVDRKKHWIHVYSAGDITLKRLHPKRGLEAIENIGIIPRYGGVVIHDCWQSYLSYEHCDHGLCGSHLLRELTFIVDSNGYAWASNMKRLLQETCATVAKRKSKRLTKKEYKNLQKRYRDILTRGAEELPPIPPRQKGKRGKIAKSDAHNLWERLKKHEAAVLRFAKLSHVPFTNNRAERDLRMSKVKQKVSGCFRTRKYAEAYCRISSYLQTMANQGYNPLVAIQMAFSGQIYADRGE
ncbi:MAG: IS66 family transposase, partial [Halieaceae bacterium]|nr:IS66 family transposase [Halieaceae bacterium]